MQLLQLIPPILIWSAFVHLAVVLAVFLIQHLLRHFINPKGSRFRTISEFLFSVGWVVLTLENTFLFDVRSELCGVIVLGLRLFVSPMLFRKVFGNPCEVLYYYLMRSPRLHKSGIILFRALLAEALAIPVGVCMSVIMWKLLASVNGEYSTFMEKNLDPFLSISPWAGFLMEACISFLMFMPGLVLPPSLFFSFVETFFIMGLVYYFGMWTGAFMNPMAATSCLLMWHSRSLQPWDVGVHLFVFLLGPLLGTLAAVKVARWKYSHRKQD